MVGRGVGAGVIVVGKIVVTLMVVVLEEVGANVGVDVATVKLVGLMVGAESVNGEEVGGEVKGASVTGTKVPGAKVTGDMIGDVVTGTCDG